MKVVILAGGMGTRISEESHLRPKPMIEIGERPILWHIMKIYSYYGFNDFIICCGYKGHMIKEYFMDYYMYQSDVTIHLVDNSVDVYENISEPWNVTLVNTGIHTPTAGRILQIRKYVHDEPFMMTYGDGVADIDIPKLLQFHQSHGKVATNGSVMLETEPYERLAQDGQMVAYKHDGFWSSMDTMRDKDYLEELWRNGTHPWKIWD